MATEIACFWTVVAGFLLADNLILVPSGGDHLRFGRGGDLRYQPGAGFELRGREVVMLNPMNPFDRVALTDSPQALAPPQAWRSAFRSVRRALPVLNLLSALGALYLLALVGLALVSWRLPFVVVLATLAAGHIGTWVVALVLVWRHREALALTRYQIIVLLAEAVFVPAYLVNLGKRAWYRQRLKVPAFVLGMRQARGAVDDERELLVLRLAERLDRIAEAQPDRLAGWMEEARLCLKTSAPSKGS